MKSDSASLPPAKLAAIVAVRQAVLDTEELLENILLHLPSRNILTSQRVSRQFRDSIRASPALQQKLFLKLLNQSNEPDKWAVQVTSAGPGEAPEYKFVRHPDPSPMKIMAVWNLTPVAFNTTFLEHFGYGEQGQPTHAAHASYIADTLGSEDEVRVRPEMLSSLSASLRGNPKSWDHMHITDPPSTTAIVSMRLGLGSRFSLQLNHLKIRDPNGVTMSRILKTALDATGHRDEEQRRGRGDKDSSLTLYDFKSLESDMHRIPYIGNVSIREVAADVQKNHDRDSKLRVWDLELLLPATVAATQEEMRAVEQEWEAREASEDGNAMG